MVRERGIYIEVVPKGKGGLSCDFKVPCHYVTMSPVRTHSYGYRTKQKTRLTQDCEYVVETHGVLTG